VPTSVGSTLSSPCKNLASAELTLCIRDKRINANIEETYLCNRQRQCEGLTELEPMESAEGYADGVKEEYKFQQLEGICYEGYGIKWQACDATSDCKHARNDCPPSQTGIRITPR